MDNLVSARLGDLVNVFIGGDAPKEYTKEASDENAVPIYSNGIEKEGLYGYTCSPKVEGDSVTISARGNVGAAFYRDKPFVPIVRLLALTPNRSLINAKYLYYLLKLDSIISTGAAQQQITAPQIKKHRITYYSDISYQNSIVAILSAYDSQIENNQKRIKLLEQMAENLYKEWFVRFRFPGYENAEFEGGMPKGWVSLVGDNKKPKGWTYGELNQLGTFIRGKNITAAEMIEGQVPVISAGLEPAGYHNQANVCGPCLTISSSGANAGYLKYNLTDIWAADCSYYNNPDNIWFVYSSLKYLQPVISNLQCGAAQPHVYPKDVNRLCVILPPKSLITEYNRQSSLIFKNIHNLKNQIFLLTQQRDLLLPRLMSGKLSI